jgi:hypothetical protein
MSNLYIQERRQIYTYAPKSQPITILQTFISCNFIFLYHNFFNTNVHSRNQYFLKLNFVPHSCYLNRCFIFILINTFVDFVFGIYSAELFLENTQYLLFLMVSLIYRLISSYLFFYLLFFVIILMILSNRIVISVPCTENCALYPKNKPEN